METSPLGRNKKWAFDPVVRIGARLMAGDAIGIVHEGRRLHKIMIPFDQADEVDVTWVMKGSVPVDTVVARIRDASGRERPLTLMQQWPRARLRSTRYHPWGNAADKLATRCFSSPNRPRAGRRPCVRPQGAWKRSPARRSIPAYPDSAIRGVYERVGVVRARDGLVGNLTMIGLEFQLCGSERPGV